jgi:DNA-binding HxlR family transcriptional regulator
VSQQQAKIDLSDTSRLDIDRLPKQGDMYNPNCPTRIVIDSVTGLWGILIIRSLYNEGTLRNAEIRQRVNGISEKMLSESLKRLERTGVVERTSYPVIPPRVDYKLTKLGKKLSKNILGLCDSIESDFRVIAKAMITFDKTSKGERPWQKPKR